MIKNKVYDNNGFTLIELVVVLMMAGTIMMLGVRFVKLYSIGQQHEVTIENVNTAFSALREFQIRNGRYPCPADPDLPPTNPNYGLSQCAGYDNCVSPTAGAITCVLGGRDTDGDSVNDPVLIGVIPFNTLNAAELTTPYALSQRVDGYGALVAYAVTEHMTDPVFTFDNPINSNTGAIRIEDENKVSLTIPDAAAHFNVFSYGNNSRGGYSSEGVLIDACLVPSIVVGDPDVAPPPGPSAPGIDVEIENCDNNDAIFAKATRSLGGNADYFDDMSQFNVESFAPLWKRTLGVASPNSFLYNTNLGDVGVGTQLPTKKLHVVGDLRAEASVITPLYCDDADATTECMDANAIGGVPDVENGGMQCDASAGEAAYAVGENQFECRKVEWIVPAKNCPVHDFDTDDSIPAETTYMAGFGSLGSLICCNKVDDSIFNPLIDTDCCKYDGTSCTPM